MRCTRPRPLLLVLLLAAGCATNPVTGKRELVLVSESQEIAMGKSYAPQVASSMGLYEDAELQAYVESIGMPMARASERPQLPWQFRVVDDPGVNAFAVPGGFIYVTRGILASMSSEAQLASVLGHEIGHVTARHSVNQLSKQQLSQIALGVGALASKQVRQALPVAAAGLQLMFLRYGRDHERQSDDLGLRYMAGAGYEPSEMIAVFRTLGRTSQAAGGSRVPAWLATHPSAADRETRIGQAIAALGEQEGVSAGARVARRTFLDRIDGITYGPDPRAGYFAGSRFHHPEMRFRVDFPEGWTTANQRQAVLALSPERDAIVQVTLAEGTSAEAAARHFLSQDGLVASSASRAAVGGRPAVWSDFAVQSKQGAVEGIALFVEYREKVYRLLGYAPQPRFAGHRDALGRALGSFAAETDRAVLAARPWRLRLVTPDRSLSIEEFARVYPGPVSAEELARINELDAGERYAAGVPVKRVSGKAWPGAAGP